MVGPSPIKLTIQFEFTMTRCYFKPERERERELHLGSKNDMTLTASFSSTDWLIVPSNHDPFPEHINLTIDYFRLVTWAEKIWRKQKVAMRGLEGKRFLSVVAGGFLTSAGTDARVGSSPTSCWHSTM